MTLLTWRVSRLCICISLSDAHNHFFVDVRTATEEGARAIFRVCLQYHSIAKPLRQPHRCERGDDDPDGAPLWVECVVHPSGEVAVRSSGYVGWGSYRR